MSEALLSVRNINKYFGGIHASRDVSLELFPGEVLALAGDNGAGKSTLIKMISGVYNPDSGEILYQGQAITNKNPQEVRNLGIETIYQDLALADNLDVPVLDRKFMRDEAKKALFDLGITVHDLSLPVRYLSGGQRQAIAISRAVYWNAKVLIMDEPTAALGVPEQREVKDLIKRLKAQGVGIIFISHNLIDIFEVSDRIVVLERGRKAGERLISETNEDEVVKLMMGR
jgi:ABC-type sugar transport system ATPase subunit